MSMISLKSLGSIALLGYVAFLLYEPLPPGIADPFALWAGAKIRQTARFINKLRGRSEFEMDLMEMFLTPPDYKDESLKIYEHHDGPARLRVYDPVGRPRPSAAVVYLHGGGFVLGSTLSYDLTVYTAAKNLENMLVFSVEYRKAPRFTFPSQIEECVAVTRYIISQASQFGIDPKRVAIMGDSAGGALAATIVIKMRPENPEQPHPIAMQVLIYPAVQALNFQSPSYQVASTGPLLSPMDVGKFVSLYHTGTDKYAEMLVNNLHTSPETKRQVADKIFVTDGIPKEYVPSTYVAPSLDVGEDVPALRNTLTWEASLLLKDLSRLPPAYVLACEHDVLRDDSFLYVDALRRFQVPTTFKFYKHAYHGILWFSKVLPKSNLGLEMMKHMTDHVKQNL